MTAIEITCSPAGGILTVSAETVAQLDRLAATLPHDRAWRIDVRLTDATLTAAPATDRPETTR